jgi:Polyketide cyclase / dehydrase and lipid transport
MSPRRRSPSDIASVPDAGRPAVATVTSAVFTPAPAHAVYRFLESLANHALIMDHRLRLNGVAPGGQGARIAIRGPLGLRRTARTVITRLEPPSRFEGTASVGRRTLAHVQWRIHGTEAGSDVTLTAVIVHVGRLDRYLLRLGGRRLLARSFDRAVELLAAAVAGDDPRTCRPCTRTAG